jgi:anti-sigma B factor antagonist
VQEFAVTTEQFDPETVVIALQGEVDLFNAPAFQQELLRRIESGATRVVLDLRDATFFDSTALRVLLEGQRELHARSGSLSVVCDEPRIQKIFTITGLDELFPFHATIDQALTPPSAASEKLDAVA